MEGYCDMVSVLIAAPWSGSGKTTVSCGLMELYLRQGSRVRAFKCGPDYIDPMYHRQVVGVPSHNLDTFFSDEDQVREIFYREALGVKENPTNREALGVNIIEGVMGLYDGLGGVREEGSSYHLAQVLDIPVLLVVDAHGMGRTIIPLLSGILQYDTDRRIAGVILNRTSQSYGQTIAPILERELRVPVLGILPNSKEFQLESRHLGLMLPEEQKDLKERLKRAADRMEDNLDIERLNKVVEFDDHGKKTEVSKNIACVCRKQHGKVRIAVARDEAFCFYYEENLRLLEEEGAELVFFSPIHDQRLPAGSCGLLLGGGYPELHLKELSENITMKEEIRQAAEEQIPIVAECGGFLYLHQSIRDRGGKDYEMAGVIHAEARDRGSLVRFGYITLREERPSFLKEDTWIKGHEFHYYDSTDNGADCNARKPVTGKEYRCIHADENHWWGFPHLYYPSNPSFVEQFVKKCRKWGEENEKLISIL